MQTWRRAKPAVGLVISHLLASTMGMAAAAILATRTLPAVRSMGAQFAQEPLRRAMDFAYAWGSESDASVLLKKCGLELPANPSGDPFAPNELAILEFRLALVEHRSQAELLQLCQRSALCKPEQLDRFMAMVASSRKVDRAP
jgi:hypothetical protein